MLLFVVLLHRLDKRDRRLFVHLLQSMLLCDSRECDYVPWFSTPDSILPELPRLCFPAIFAGRRSALDWVVLSCKSVPPIRRTASTPLGDAQADGCTQTTSTYVLPNSQLIPSCLYPDSMSDWKVLGQMLFHLSSNLVHLE